ncbi:zinc finger, CCHC-type containing protein, partial [Tanacetum coccineum]
TVRFLLLNTTIEVNSTNTNGETPLDILAQVPRDLTYQQIMLSLTHMGLDRVAYHHSKDGPTNYEDWLDRKRNSLMVVASLIATMAFQAGVNPPSGVWQDDSPNNDPLHMAGYAIMCYQRPFSKFDSSGKGVITCLYVDDMLIFGTDQNQVDKTKKILSSKFSMKDMGEADVKSYWLLDVCYDNIGKSITRVFKYLRGTKDYGLSYVGYPSVLEGYSDASWINHVEDSSSTSGWVFLLG